MERLPGTADQPQGRKSWQGRWPKKLTTLWRAASASGRRCISIPHWSTSPDRVGSANT